MNDTCIWTDMEHNVFIWYLRFLGLFSTPTCLFVVYLIWRHSPKYLGTYRGYLLCYALSGCSMDIFFTILINPVVFLPEMAAYTRGLLQYLPKTTTAATYYFYWNIGTLLMSSVMLLMHQFRIMLPDYIVSWWTKKTNLGVYLVAELFLTLFFFYSVIMDEGFFQKAELKHGARKFSCLIPMFQQPSAIYFEREYISGTLSLFLGLGAFFAVWCAVGSVLTVATLNKITNPTSERTANMHKRFLRRLQLQVAIPYLLVIIPFIIFSIFTLTGDRVTFEYLGDLFIGTVATHGVVSAISILIANEHYFKIVKGLYPVSADANELSTIATTSL